MSAVKGSCLSVSRVELRFVHKASILLDQHQRNMPVTKRPSTFIAFSDVAGKWHTKFDSNRHKSWHLNLPSSLGVHQQPITNDPHDVTTPRTAAGIMANKQKLFDHVKLSKA